MPAGRKTTDPAKCLAKRALADRKSGTKSWDLEGLVDFGERQHLSPFNEVSTAADGLGTESMCPHIG
jgi:hypothetical protein